MEKARNGEGQCTSALPRKGRVRFLVNLNLLISSNAALLNFEEG